MEKTKKKYNDNYMYTNYASDTQMEVGGTSKGQVRSAWGQGTHEQWSTISKWVMDSEWVANKFWCHVWYRILDSKRIKNPSTMIHCSY